ncbi:MauE/DoxX family redox-associated membrane protein [Aureliella helgolandensis]|uniref:Methylamine utilisation protein MauE domain-containing protein n=1 Tax=Aureliella helgolandensis TaxID=2527968 RepID=A0A518GAY6_9BACT|nr:hypothetical protein [Aureliella helgolandensis]QDV25771.1 hypothetical protein Q31a_40980 [Aureliella helgolandensis]
MSDLQQPEQPLNERARTRLAWSLLLIRVGIFSVFVMWTIDKFINPEHAAAVFKKFYGISELSELLAYVVGGVQMVILLVFLVGAFRTWSYGIILGLHAISTFSSWSAYIDPWTYPHLLFFAAIPMLSACITLWLLREFDTYTVDGCRRPRVQPNASQQVA